MRKLFFVIPEFRGIITGGTLYDLQLGIALKENFIYQNNILINQQDSDIKISLKLKKIPTGSIICIDGLILSKLKNIINDLSTKFKVIILIHHPESMEESSSPFNKINNYLKERKVLNSNITIVAVSHYIKKELRKYLNKYTNIAVAHPGIDECFFNNTKISNKYNIISIGNIIPRKGYHNLIEAVHKVDLDWTLNIIGNFNINKSYYFKLKQKIIDLNLEKRVHFHGTVNKFEMLSLMEKSKVFVLPTLYEGFGMSLLEASIFGLKVITTDIPVLREALKGQQAIFVERNDNAWLSKSIKEGLISEKKHHQIYNKDIYTWKMTKNNFLRVYNEQK